MNSLADSFLFFGGGMGGTDPTHSRYHGHPLIVFDTVMKTVKQKTNKMWGLHKERFQVVYLEYILERLETFLSSGNLYHLNCTRAAHWWSMVALTKIFCHRWLKKYSEIHPRLHTSLLIGRIGPRQRPDQTSRPFDIMHLFRKYQKRSLGTPGAPLSGAKHHFWGKRK